MGSAEKFFEKITLADIVRYMYGPVLLLFLFVIIKPCAMEEVFEDIPPSIIVLGSLLLGLGVYTLHRSIVIPIHHAILCQLFKIYSLCRMGKERRKKYVVATCFIIGILVIITIAVLVWICIPLFMCLIISFISYIVTLLIMSLIGDRHNDWKKASTNPVTILGEWGVPWQLRIISYTILRRANFFKEMNRNLNLEHALNGIPVMTFEGLVVAAFYSATVRCPEVQPLVFICLAILFFILSYPSAFILHSLEGRYMRRYSKPQHGWRLLKDAGIPVCDTQPKTEPISMMR